MHCVKGTSLSGVLGEVVDHVWPEDEPGPLLHQDQLDLTFGTRFGEAGILKKSSDHF